jgi:hypothetical protein
MPELNLHNIEQIIGDVRHQEIGFSHLFHDLVDHICCDIEYEMQQGFSFDEAYGRVKAKIGFRGLKIIQEDTLYAVDTKYRNMKNLMKMSGVAGTVMLGFAAIFRISHWPLAGVLLTLGALILSFLFLPSALIVLWKETKNQNKLFLFVSAFIAGAAFIFGMIFKVQHWPGANYVISFGLITGTILFVPSLLISLFRDEEKKPKRFLYVSGAISAMIYIAGFWFRIMHWSGASLLILSGCFLLFFFVFPWFTVIQWRNENNIIARFIFMVIAPLLFVMPGALVNLNLERNYEEGFFNRLEKQDALINLQKESNNRFMTLYHDSLVSPQMESIHSSALELLDLINMMEHNMVEIAEGSVVKTNQASQEPSGSHAGNPIQYRTIQIPFSARPASLMLLPGCKAREVLEKEVSKFKELLIRKVGAEWTGEYNALLNSSDYLPASDIKGNDLLLMPILNTLSLMESAVLITESAALKQVSSKK